MEKSFVNFKRQLKSVLDALSEKTPDFSKSDLELFRHGCERYFITIPPIICSDIEILNDLRSLLKKY